MFIFNNYIWRKYNIGAVVHWEHSAEIGIILSGQKKRGNAGQKEP